MVWTEPADVIGSWIGDDAPSDEALVVIWIGRAERLLRKKMPGLTARIDAAEVDLLETVQDVVSNMVQRVFRNPSGTRQTNITTGPFTESSTFGGDQPGYLWVTDEELASLLGEVATSRSAFEIDPLVGYVFPSRGVIL
jgi:hypothetical protein